MLGTAAEGMNGSSCFAMSTNLSGDTGAMVPVNTHPGEPGCDTAVMSSGIFKKTTLAPMFTLVPEVVRATAKVIESNSISVNPCPKSIDQVPCVAVIAPLNV